MTDGTITAAKKILKGLKPRANQKGYLLSTQVYDVISALLKMIEGQKPVYIKAEDIDLEKLDMTGGGIVRHDEPMEISSLLKMIDTYQERLQIKYCYNHKGEKVEIPEDERDDFPDKIFSLNVELDELVTMVKKARNLERLQETVGMNFPLITKQE